jgi:thymidylate synthase
MAHTIGSAWILAIQEVLKYGTEVEDDKGSILEVVPITLEIVNPSLDDPIITKYGSEEYLSFLRQNFEVLTDLPEWGYSYAQRLYSYNGHNQVEGVIAALKSNLYTKSATISLLNKHEDEKHTPCLTTLDFKVRDQALIITAFFRSQDIGNKMYGDALQLLKLGHNMIGELPANDVRLLFFISSAHMYIGDLPRMEAIVSSSFVP